MTGSLSQQDVARLMADPSPDIRAETTAKIATQYDRKFPRMTEAERKIAEDIFRALAADAEVLVREALAANLKTTADLPHDLAVALAKDVDSVSLPVLKYSEVLTDDDLIEIVRGENAAANLILQTRERATVSLLSRGATGADLEELVFQIHVNGRLTPTLVIRALCVGDMPFFEAAIARLANVPMKNARKLIHDGGDLGLRSIYEKANMPERLFSAVRAAVQILAEEQYDGGRNDRERFVARIIERLLTQFEDPASKMTQDDIDYLMNKLRQLAA